MSEKISNWQKVKGGFYTVLISAPFILLAVIVFFILYLIPTVIIGIISTFCWNIALTFMFGFSKIKLVQACVLTFTISCLRCNYFVSTKSTYINYKDTIFKECQKEKMSKIISIILTTIFGIIQIIATIWLVMYSWNNILPQLLNTELIQINFVQAMGFSYLFNLLFKHCSSNNNNKEKENQENQEIDEVQNDTYTEMSIE